MTSPPCSRRRCKWIGDVEHAYQVLFDGPGLCGFGFGASAECSLSHDAASQQRERHGGGCHARGVAADEFLQAIADAVVSCEHRVSVEEPPQIVTKRRDGRVSPLGFVTQRFHHDRIDVAAQPTAQSRRCRAARAGDLLPGRPVVDVERRGRPRRRALADDALDVCSRPPREFVRPPPAHEEIQQHAEAIDIAPDRNGFSTNLFRRGEIGGERPPIPGERIERFSAVGRQQGRDPEVQQLHRAVGR